MSVLLAAPLPDPVCYPDETAYTRVGNSSDIALRCPDPAERPYALQVVDAPALGRVVVEHRSTGDVLRYTADADVKLDQHGPSGFPYTVDRFTYTASDDSAGPFRVIDQRVLIVSADANNAPACGVYTGTRQLGYDATDPIDVEVGESLPLTVNCIDSDGDPVGAPVAAPVDYGTLRGPVGGAFSYTPPPGDPGPDGTRTTLSFTATDAPQLPATGAPLTSVPARRYIRVIRADNDPTCADQTVVVAENSGPTDVPVRCTDADPGDSIRVGVTGSQSDITAGLPDDGSSGLLFVQPRHGFSGVETVTFTATDGGGFDDTSAPATLTVVVEPRVHRRTLQRVVKPYLRDDVAPTVLAAIRDGRPVGPFTRRVRISARVGGASTTLAAGSLQLARGERADFPLRLSRAGRILQADGRLHGRLTVTVGSAGVSGRASGAFG